MNKKLFKVSANIFVFSLLILFSLMMFNILFDAFDFFRIVACVNFTICIVSLVLLLISII